MDRVHSGPGLLSSKQREYLVGESDIEDKSDAERRRRQAIRDRIRNAILDFSIVGNFMEDRDLDQVVDSIRQEDDLEGRYHNGLYWGVALMFQLGNKGELEKEDIVEDAVYRSDYPVLNVETEIEITPVPSRRPFEYEPGTVEEMLINEEKPHLFDVAMAAIHDDLDDTQRQKIRETGYRWEEGGMDVEFDAE